MKGGSVLTDTFLIGERDDLYSKRLQRVDSLWKGGFRRGVGPIHGSRTVRLACV